MDCHGLPVRRKNRRLLAIQGVPFRWHSGDRASPASPAHDVARPVRAPPGWNTRHGGSTRIVVSCRCMPAPPARQMPRSLGTGAPRLRLAGRGSSTTYKMHAAAVHSYYFSRSSSRITRRQRRPSTERRKPSRLPSAAPTVAQAIAPPGVFWRPEIAELCLLVSDGSSSSDSSLRNRHGSQNPLVQAIWSCAHTAATD